MYSGMAMGKKQEVILQVKVIPVDLADESLNLLPKDSFSHACVIGKFIERLMGALQGAQIWFSISFLTARIDFGRLGRRPK